MSCYESIGKFVSSLSGGLSTDITIPQSINIQKMGTLEQKSFLVVNIAYAVDYKMLSEIIENFKIWFMGRTVWSDEPPIYHASSAEHSFAWKDGTKVFIRTNYKETT